MVVLGVVLKNVVALDVAAVMRLYDEVGLAVVVVAGAVMGAAVVDL